MTPYFLLYMLLVGGSWFINHLTADDEVRKKTEVVLLIVLIFLIIGLRHPSMGWDLQYGKYGGYLWSFQNISNNSLLEVFRFNGWLNYEIGFILFNKLISFISKDIQCLLICSALLSLIPIGVTIHRYSRNTLMSVLVYLGLPSFMILFSGLRQGIGISLCCITYPYIINKKPIKFVLLVLIASLFHYSAICFLIAYPIFNFHMGKTLRYISLLGILLVFVLRKPLFTILSKLLKDNAQMDYNGAITLLLVFTLVYIFCIIFLDNDDSITSGFVNCFYLGVLCMCFGNVNQLAMRVAYYYMIALVIALPNIVMSISNIKNRMITLISIEVAFFIYSLYALWSSGNSWPMSFPYHFFWEEIF